MTADIREFLTAQFDAEDDEAELSHAADCPANLLAQTDEELYEPADPSRCAPTCPARRPLAEVAAKRRILELHVPVVETVEWFDCPDNSGRAAVCTSCRPADPTTNWRPRLGEAGIRPEGFVPSYVLAPCQTLRLLASPYRDHPDFDPSWEVTE